MLQIEKFERVKRDCENCSHYVIKDDKTNIRGCESWECNYENKEDNDNDKD